MKWSKIVNVPTYNQIILKLFNWSICFLFAKKTLAAMISNINKVRELSARVCKANIYLKLVLKTCTFIKFPKLSHLWTLLGVFLTWYNWPTQFQQKCGQLTTRISEKKANPKSATFPYPFIIFVTFLSFLSNIQHRTHRYM